MPVLSLLALLLAPPVPILPTPLRPPRALGATPPAPRATTVPHPLFLNFGGATLTSTSDCSDAPNDCSFIVNGGGGGQVNFPAFSGSPALKDEIITLVRQYYLPFNVQIVTERPASPPYSMVMIGGSAASVGLGGSGAAGVAPLDCLDQNPSDISFAFSEEVGNNPLDVAVTAAQESAHGYGLGHTDDPTDIMFPALSGQEMQFQDRTMNIYDLGGGSSSCDGSGIQNSFQLLMTTVGMGVPPGPDTMPPMVSFVSPQNGEQVPSGFHIEFDAFDDRGVTALDVFANDAMVGSLPHAPWAVDVPGGTFPPGPLTLRGVARDAAGNQSETGVIMITVKALGETPGDLGSICTGDADCPGGFCAYDPGPNKHFCSRSCDMQTGCPGSFVCQNAGGKLECVAAPNAGNHTSGGCGVVLGGPSTRSALGPVLLLGLGAFALVWLRRRRR